MSAPRGSPGFTLTELLVVTMLVSIILTGLGAMLLSQYRAEIHSLRQSHVDATADAVAKRLQRDFAQATSIGNPGVGSSESGNNARLNGYFGSIWDGAWQTSFGVAPERFAYRVCNSGTELQYWRWSCPSGGCAVKACGSNSPDPMVLLVSAPLRIENASFFRPSYHMASVQFDVVYPSTTVNPEIRRVFQADLTAQVSGTAP